MVKKAVIKTITTVIIIPVVVFIVILSVSNPPIKAIVRRYSISLSSLKVVLKPYPNHLEVKFDFVPTNNDRAMQFNRVDAC